MDNHTGTASERLEKLLWVQEPGKATEKPAPSRTRVTTSRANEIRITWAESVQVPSPFRWVVNQLTGETTRQRGLVYSDEAQPLATGFKRVQPRKRTFGLTTNAKRTIREGSAVMRDEFAKQIAFITLTLPGSSLEAMQGIAKYAHEIHENFNNKLHKKIKRWYGSNNVAYYAVDDLAVWEPQKRGALHMHKIVGINDKRLYAYIKATHQRWWRETLEFISDKYGVDLFARLEGGSWRGVDHLPRTECKKVKHDVGAYLSKYMSKLAHATLEDDGLTPARWWYVSKSLMEKVRNGRREAELPAEGIADAEADGHQVALIGLHETSSHYKMMHPFTGRHCGYVLYFETNESKEGCYVKMTEYLELKNGAIAANHEPDSMEQFLNIVENGNCFDAFISPDLMKKINADGCADLCAPSSASEEGGGRW